MNSNPSSNRETLPRALRISIHAIALGMMLALPCADGQNIVHQTGFEPDSKVSNNNSVSGADNTLAPPNNLSSWGVHLLPDANPANRTISIVNDPAGGLNKVFRTWSYNTTAGTSKIEINRFTPLNWKDELHARFRVRLDGGMQALETYSSNLDQNASFIILAEFWIATGSYPTGEDRMSLRLYKVGGKLRFALTKDHAHYGGYMNQWVEVGREDLQFDQWYTVELYLKLGDADHGLAMLRYQRQGGAVQEHVVRRETHHPDHPFGAINGFVHCKFYTDSHTLQHLRERSGGAIVYFDDVQLRDGFPGGAPAPKVVDYQQLSIDAEDLFHAGRVSRSNTWGGVVQQTTFMHNGAYVSHLGSGGDQWISFNLTGLESLPPGDYRFFSAEYEHGNSPAACEVSWNGTLRKTLNLRNSYNRIRAHDLGVFNISASGPNTLRFGNIDQGSTANGERLRFDRVIAYPRGNARWIEAESLAHTASGPSPTMVADNKASGDQWVSFGATAAGQWIEFKLPNIPAGEYGLRVRYKALASRGQTQITHESAQGSTKIGAVRDQYSHNSFYARQGHKEHFVGNVTFSTSGEQRLRFTVTGKNGRSSGYSLSIDEIILQPVLPAAVLHLSADHGVLTSAGAPASEGAAVAVWKDAAVELGGINDAVQTTSARRPTFITQGIQLPSGLWKPVVNFVGGGIDNDTLQTNLPMPSGEFTGFAVARSAMQNYQSLLATSKINVGDNQFSWGIFFKSGSQYRHGVQTKAPGVNSFISVNNAALTSWTIMEVRGSGTKIEFAENGGAVSVGSGHNLNFNSTPICIGGGNSLGDARAWNGPVAEILLFDRRLSDPEANQVGWYLSQKYGLSADFVAP
jgi:hypothetical protein